MGFSDKRMGENIMIYVSHLLRDEEMKELVEDFNAALNRVNELQRFI